MNSTVSLFKLFWCWFTVFTIKASNVSLWQELVPLSYFYSDWIRRLQVLHKLKIILLEGVNGVSRLATNGKKYYRLPTKREKKLPTTGTWTDTIYIYIFFFSERRVYCIFSTFLGRNQRYHVTSLFTFLHITCEKCLD